MSFLSSYQRDLERERDAAVKDRKKIADATGKAASKRSDLNRTTSASRAKQLASDIERAEKDRASAEGSLAKRERKIADLEKKIADIRRKDAADQEKKAKKAAQDQAAFQRRSEQAQRDIDRRSQEAAKDFAALSARVESIEDSLLGRVAGLVKADRVNRSHDVFLSYATPDAALATALNDEMLACGLDTFYADVDLELGVSLFNQINVGLASAKLGVILVTPAYMEGRVWTERELGALMATNRRVIPVVDQVQFEQLADKYPFLSDLVGLDTIKHPLNEIAEQIAKTVGKGLGT